MATEVDDYALGLAASYRAALVSVWQQVRECGDPRLEGIFQRACQAGAETEIAASLPCRFFSDDYIDGLQAAMDELKALSPAPAPSTA